MKILAIIPARGGSKGIPRKNIKLLCGKPLIAWTIDAAKAVNVPMRVIVSTDDEEIAKIAREHGAEVPFLRPQEISVDYSTDVEFLLHALDWLELNEGYVPDVVLRLPPTSPLRTSAHIEEAIKCLVADPQLDSVRPIMEAPKHPFKMWKLSEDQKRIIPFLPESVTGFSEPQNLPRQLLGKVYIHTGAIDAMRLHTIRQLRSTSGASVGFFFMNEMDSINIDHPIDFFIAEAIMRQRLDKEAEMGA